MKRHWIDEDTDSELYEILASLAMDIYDHAGNNEIFVSFKNEDDETENVIVVLYDHEIGYSVSMYESNHSEALPVMVENEQLEPHMGSGYKLVCPECGYDGLADIDADTNFCPECGRKLDWSDIDNEVWLDYTGLGDE